MDKLATAGQSMRMVRSTKEAHKEAERMRDVMILLQHLNEREETTIKMILDCLYDVGSINLINQKFHNRSLNRLLKSIAWMPKPAFKIFAMRWFKKNCPQLITKWIYSKIRFELPQAKPSEVVSGVVDAQASALTVSDRLAASKRPVATENAPVSENTTVSEQASVLDKASVSESDRQIQQLRSQVRVLTGLLIGVSILLGGALVLPNHNSGAGLITPQEKLNAQP